MSKILQENERLVQLSEIGGLLHSNPGEIIHILGPCALQSEAQMTAIIEILTTHLSTEHIQYVRAPAVKPRTLPNTFEGLGISNSLSIYDRLKLKYPWLRLAGEVMRPEEIAPQQNILDLPWIGARSNQQTIETLASQIKESHWQVAWLVKNTLTGNIKDHLGLMARLAALTDNSVALIPMLRGRDPWNDSTYRSVPNFDKDTVARYQDATGSVVAADISHILNKSDMKPENGIELYESARDAGVNVIMAELHTQEHSSVVDPGFEVGVFAHLLNQIINNQAQEELAA